MSQTLSSADQTYLPAEQQKEIQRLKQAWNDAYNAGDTAAMNAAHDAAEAIRATANYSGGSDGSAYLQGGSAAVPAGAGQSAAEVQAWVDNYKYTNYSDAAGWANGFSSDMNLRSMANYIRQQMQANSNAWANADEAGKAYLHDQNVQLAQILADSVGGAESTYNEELGRWETSNANLGYGFYTGAYQDLDFYRNYYGMTDAQIEAYQNDTDRYYNYVDQAIIRNWIDDTSGYTGRYAQFVNGPYTALLNGDNGVARSTYIDLIGDGEGQGENDLADRPLYDADGNVIPVEPYLKNNNGMSDYTRERSSYVDENGVIQPGIYLQTNPAGLRKSGASQGSGTTAASGGSTGVLDQWASAAAQQTVSSHDYAVDQAVAQLLQAQAEADAAYQTQRDQIYRDERNALDNSALYAEARGDRGGIGQTQYNQIQATAAANRQAVSTAQTQLAAETSRQIARLRAEGEFEKADALLELSQTYLLKLLDLQQWALENGVDVSVFSGSLQQWQQEYLLNAAQTMI